MSGTILPASLAFLAAIVQDNTLAREFRDALYPQILFREEAMPEKWEVNVGDVQVFTRASLLAPTVVPLTPGADPTPKSPSFEQWQVKAAQFGDSIDTHMPSSRTALAPIFARNAKTLGLQAGQSLNRLCRNKLYSKYTGGDTVTSTTSGATTTLAVASINGFTTVIVDGAEVPVSGGAPKTARVSGVAGTVNVIAATPTDPVNNPFGPGTLTLSAAIAVTSGARVLATDAPRIIRVGNAATVDGLSATSTITLREIRQAIATLRRNRVPTHPDGYYHVHLDPIAESQIFNDNEFQRLNQGVPDGLRYAEQAIGRLLGAIFFSNNESPNVFNSAPSGESGLISTSRSSAVASPEFYGEVRNAAGIGVIRTIITGGGAIMEKYIDEESDYMTEAGYVGKVGQFSVVNNGIQISTERIRYIIRAPQDRLQQQVSQSWSWSGDWGVPADLLGGLLGGRYKRAVVIESGSED